MSEVKDHLNSLAFSRHNIGDDPGIGDVIVDVDDVKQCHNIAISGMILMHCNLQKLSFERLVMMMMMLVMTMLMLMM